MRTMFLLPAFLFFLSLNSGALGADKDATGAEKDLKAQKIEERVKLQEEMISNLTGANEVIRAKLESIVKKVPQTEKQYVELALKKLTTAEEGIKTAKGAMALTKAQTDVEHKNIMSGTVSKIIRNVISLHEEISVLLEELEDRLEFVPSGKPRKNGGRAVG